MDTLSDRIKSGDAAGVRELLDRNPEVLNAPAAGAPSPILLAMYHGKPGVADVLRQYRPKLDLFDAAALGDRHEVARNLTVSPQGHAEYSPDGFTALGYAAYFGHAEVVRDLLDAGADPKVASQNGLAVCPIHSALSGGHKEMARLLLERSGDFDAASGAGWTPLHYAAHNGDIETAKFLLDHQAKRGVRNADGKIPADLAEERGFADLAQILRPVGA